MGSTYGEIAASLANEGCVPYPIQFLPLRSRRRPARPDQSQNLAAAFSTWHPARVRSSASLWRIFCVSCNAVAPLSLSVQAKRYSLSGFIGTSVVGTGGISQRRSSFPAIKESARRKSSTERASGPASPYDALLAVNRVVRECGRRAKRDGLWV